MNSKRSTLRYKKKWKIAVLANIKDDNHPRPEGVPPDAFADFDYIETIEAIRTALETDGHTTVFVHADRELPYKLKKVKPDICFNIAEGMGGDAREAQIPALLELLSIPYTGSRVLTNGISLDKTLTKRIWRDRRLPVAPFQEFFSGNETLRNELQFPLFVKPAYGGTGMGIDLNAITNNENELHNRIKYLIETYGQPVLVESFLPGREFTVGHIGRPDAINFSKHPEWYDADGFHRFPITEVDNTNSVTPGIYSHAAKTIASNTEGATKTICPAEIDKELSKKLYSLALQAHKAINALDVSRVDIRLDAENQPCLIEINPLPGLTPDYSDLCLMANAEGITYTDLILEILYLGASRWNLINPN